MAEKPKDFSERTQDFALRITRLFEALPESRVAQLLGGQLWRAGTSIGAHYAEAKHARSTAEFVSKIGGALQETQETIYWLELLQQAGMVEEHRLSLLIPEANELRAILLTMSANVRNPKGSKSI